MWQELNTEKHADVVRLLLRPNFRTGKKCDLSDFDHAEWFEYIRDC